MMAVYTICKNTVRNITYHKHIYRSVPCQFQVPEVPAPCNIFLLVVLAINITDSKWLPCLVFDKISKFITWRPTCEARFHNKTTIRIQMETETKEKLDRLRARRAGHRGVCTKLENNATELIQTADENELERCEVIVNQLRAKVNLLGDLDDEICNICDVKEIQQEIEDSATISDRIFESIRKIEKYVRTAKSQRNVNTSNTVTNLNTTVGQGNIETTEDSASNSASTSVENDGNTSNNASIVDNSPSTTEQTTPSATVSPAYRSFSSSLPKLPKLQLPKFGGRVTEWSSFWDLYDSAIHSNSSISKVNKFNYLQTLLEGNAA